MFITATSEHLPAPRAAESGQLQRHGAADSDRNLAAESCKWRAMISGPSLPGGRRPAAGLRAPGLMGRDSMWALIIEWRAGPGRWAGPALSGRPHREWSDADRPISGSGSPVGSEETEGRVWRGAAGRVWARVRTPGSRASSLVTGVRIGPTMTVGECRGAVPPCTAALAAQRAEPS